MLFRSTRDAKFREDLFYRLNTVPIAIPALRERKEDIVLLFRKFASDFAEKYRMPAVKLTDDAKQLLSNYFWNGNVRQLKNITEQISVIEQLREINGNILRNYLPKDEIERLPALLSTTFTDNKTFNSEREILYQVLFDMKKDMNELKKLVHDIISNQPEDIQSNFIHHQENLFQSQITPNVELLTDKLSREGTQISTKLENKDDFQEADEYHVLESTAKPTTLANMEKQMIREALEKFRGKKKLVAKELDVSERTLYRKIKEYSLENL